MAAKKLHKHTSQYCQSIIAEDNNSGIIRNDKEIQQNVAVCCGLVAVVKMILNLKHRPCNNQIKRFQTQGNTSVALYLHTTLVLRLLNAQNRYKTYKYTSIHMEMIAVLPKQTQCTLHPRQSFYLVTNS